MVLKSFSDLRDAVSSMTPLDFYQEMQTNCMHYSSAQDLSWANPSSNAHDSPASSAAAAASSLSLKEEAELLMDGTSDEDDDEYEDDDE